MTLLQVDKLLSRGGHFFMVTVPENKPEGELHMNASWVLSAKGTPCSHREPDAFCVNVTEILALLSKNGLRGKLRWSCVPGVKSITSFLLIAVSFRCLVLGVCRRSKAAPASIGLPTCCHQGSLFITKQSLLQQIVPCIIQDAQAFAS